MPGALAHVLASQALAQEVRELRARHADLAAARHRARQALDRRQELEPALADLLLQPDLLLFARDLGFRRDPQGLARQSLLDERQPQELAELLGRQVAALDLVGELLVDRPRALLE